MRHCESNKQGIERGRKKVTRKRNRRKKARKLRKRNLKRIRKRRYEVLISNLKDCRKR